MESHLQVKGLLAEARNGATDSLGELLQLYRNYLTVLATSQLNDQLRRRLSPSDVVQEMMLKASSNFQEFEGESAGELLAWLRRILINCLHHAYETHVRACRRDVRREISLYEAPPSQNGSIVPLAELLPNGCPSPGKKLDEHEVAAAIVNQLFKLPADYRMVIELRSLHALPFEEVAKRMNRNSGAVRMLWMRAIDALRQVYEDTNE